MGQLIEVEAQAIGEVAVFDSDRSLTGQDGDEFASREEAEGGSDFPAGLAARLFADDAVEHVFVMSNGVSVKRAGGWDGPALQAAAAVIRNFFVFYEENQEG